MKKIYYVKEGRRYVPVAEYDNDLLDSFPEGAHLVMCYPGGQSRRFNIDPNHAAMIAAGRVAEDAICRVLRDAGEARPKERPITDRQRAAWQEMKDAFDDEFFHISYACARDCAEAAMAAMMAEAESLMSHPAVREAYSQFQTVCDLVKDSQSDSK